MTVEARIIYPDTPETEEWIITNVDKFTFKQCLDMSRIEKIVVHQKGGIRHEYRVRA